MPRFYFILCLCAAAGLASADIWGFGAHTTGGVHAPEHSIYTVTNLYEFRNALDNGGKPNDPKIINISGVIDGDVLPDGTLATEGYYTKNSEYTFQRYLNSFNATLKGILGNSTNPADAAELKIIEAQETYRQAVSTMQQDQIALKVGNNTTIQGAVDARTAMVQNCYIAINNTDNVILSNFQVYAPVDLFPEWEPTDGPSGHWNAKYDAIGIVTSTNIWVDHLSLSDGDHPDSKEPIALSMRIIRHDGLIDITEASDLITLSSNRFFNHDKTHLIGNTDNNSLGPGDIGKLHVTIYGNHYNNSVQRSPRVRFGQAHVFNNYYEGDSSGDSPTIYFIGMGINSNILSECNAFNINGPETLANKTGHVVMGYKGYTFKDVGSIMQGEVVDIEAIAKREYDRVKAAEVTAAATARRAVAEWATHEYTDKAFVPDYTYTVLKAEDVKDWVLQNAGYRSLK